MILQDLPTRLSHQMVPTNGLRLHAVEAGAGDPVVLLHGFPEFWYSWRSQLPALAEAGFRAIAVDLRGYNESDRPPGVASYRVKHLVADIAGVIQHFAAPPAFVVGHDWGGIIAWKLAALHPELVRGLAVLNAPHPAAFQQELKRSPAQWLRSSYAALFQLPWLPERLLRFQDFALLTQAWRESTEAAAFPEDEIAQYRKAFNKSGLEGPLNYYRATARYPGDLFGPPQKIATPTLVLWGERDPFLSRSLPDELEKWVANVIVERYPHTSHWIQNQQPQQVNESLIRFFQRDCFIPENSQA